MMAKHVLVVDDDADIRFSVREVLQDAGYRVDLAINGREALAFLEREPTPPSVILLDLMMPEMDGRAFLEALQQLPTGSAIAVIVFSAHTQSKQGVAGLKVAGHLKKPVRRSELIKAIARVSPAP